ncbi:serine/threonine protein kinase [Candidatus Collinsella stercoripullorum]|uniref:serine/threonine protein kinase n=1 Tax=Candidatus Collinsella stercoripullorum TaxID=2838522 RepID=UPI0022DF502D|nr:protein kinase [Candidatus Collinsella stercoripullorum]
MDTEDRTHDDADLSSELDGFLEAAARSDSWRVERTLKSSPFETTELVRFRGASGGELGPFIRKRIDCSAGVGRAYERLWDAQRSGVILHGVPRLVECLRSGDELSVVTEFIEGRTLGELVRDEGASERLATGIMPALCDAVFELHTLLDPPLIHRDLKPSNVIVRSDGRPFVIDFGIARAWDGKADADTVRFGTRAYAPPEQFGFGQTDARSDVYALGKLALFCATGGEGTGPADEADLRRRGLFAPLSEVIARATAFDPARRFSGARALGWALRECAAAGGMSALPEGDPFGYRVPSPSSGRAAGPIGAALPAATVPGTAVSAVLGTGRAASATPGADQLASAVSAPGPAASVALATGRAASITHETDQLGSAVSAPGPAAPPASASDSIASAVPAPRRNRVAAVLDRIPLGVGVVWDLVVLFVYAFCVLGSVFAIVRPNENDAALPLWFRVMEYGLLIIVCFGVIGWALLDKRPLRAIFPRLPRLGFLRGLLLGVGIVGSCFVATVAAAIYVGV